jgi:hypothetical protein
MYVRVRALANFLLLLLLCCSPIDSEGNVTVADNDGMPMFKPYRAHWQLKSCLLAAVRCKTLWLASKIDSPIRALQLRCSQALRNEPFVHRF